MSEARKLDLYLHTHWDREWYLTHEEHRSQLVFVVEDLIDKLEKGVIPSFFLDGQSSLLEDVEEVAPELFQPLSDLVRKGVLEVGPWYVLADQMLVSGESLMRNMEIGLSIARQYGQPAMIGYCPDTFGHSQDLPRILESFGISNCFVWRGVPDLGKSALFYWTSPNGSKVLSYHLARSYYQRIFHLNATAEKLAEFFLSWLDVPLDNGSESMSEFAPPSLSRPFAASLIPIGADHLAAPPRFDRQLEAARLLLKIENVAHALGQALPEETAPATKRASTSLSVQTTTLTAFAEVMQAYASSKSSVILEIAHELRENASALGHERAYVLPGVLSTRLYLKRLNRLAERRLIRVTEPVFTFLNCRRIMPYPDAQLNYAWRTLLRNHPHDSICGCSVDAVHREMLLRFEKTDSILNVLERKAFEALAAGGLPAEDFPSALDFSPGGDQECGAPVATDMAPMEKRKSASKNKSAHLPANQPARAQPIYNVDYQLKNGEENPAPLALATIGSPPLADPLFPRRKLILSNLCGESAIGPIPISWCEELSNDEEDGDDVRIYCDSQGTTWQVTGQKERLLVFTGTHHPPVTKTVRVYEGWVFSDHLPSFGWHMLPWPGWQDWRQGPRLLRASHDDAAADQRRISNDLLTVEAAPDGAIVVTVPDAKKRANVYRLGHHLRDVGDGGDSYNFDPIEGDSSRLARFTGVAVVERGPLVASLLVTYEMDIPEGMVEKSRIKDVPEDRVTYARAKYSLAHRFETKIELRKSVPIVFFETTWQNHSRNHRLEVVMDTGLSVQKTLSENHFSLVERSLPKKASLPVPPGTEAPLDRFACQRFFVANRQVFFNTGLPEYGVDGANVSMTILRAVSHLSRDDLRSRGGGAAPICRPMKPIASERTKSITAGPSCPGTLPAISSMPPLSVGRL